MQKLREFFGNIRHFFEENVTSYTYLFFMQVYLVGAQIYLNTYRHGLDNEILYNIIIPFYFLLGSLSTHKWPKTKSRLWRMQLYSLDFLLYNVVIFSGYGPVTFLHWLPPPPHVR